MSGISTFVYFEQLSAFTALSRDPYTSSTNREIRGKSILNHSNFQKKKKNTSSLSVSHKYTPELYFGKVLSQSLTFKKLRTEIFTCT